MRRQTFGKYFGSSAKPELVHVIDAMEGKRPPVSLNWKKQYGDTADRAPPYRPEAHPVELLWARPRLKGGYGQRYEATGAGGRVDQFSAGVDADELSTVVRHCDIAAEGLARDEPPFS